MHKTLGMQLPFVAYTVHCLLMKLLAPSATYWVIRSSALIQSTVSFLIIKDCRFFSSSDSSVHPGLNDCLSYIILLAWSKVCNVCKVNWLNLKCCVVELRNHLPLQDICGMLSSTFVMIVYQARILYIGGNLLYIQKSDIHQLCHFASQQSVYHLWCGWQVVVYIFLNV